MNEGVNERVKTACTLEVTLNLQLCQLFYFVSSAKELRLGILPRTLGTNSYPNPTGLSVRIERVNEHTAPPLVAAHGRCSVNSPSLSWKILQKLRSSVLV